MPSNPPKIPSRRTTLSLRPEEIVEELELYLEHPDAVLELLVVRLSKGQHDAELWDRLHQAAARDRRQPELALAYEQHTSERRLRALTPEAQGELLDRARAFFGDVFGDTDTALGHAERALLADPTRVDNLGRIEAWLMEQGQLSRLARAYLAVARVTGDPEERDRLFLQAVSLAEQDGSDRSLAVDVLEDVTRHWPNVGGSTFAAIEEHLVALGRWRDASRRMESRLAAGGLSLAEEMPLRERLLQIFTREFPEPQKSIAQVEFVLTHEPSHALALQAAERLCSIPFVAPRALAALSDAHGRMGNLDREAALLTQELKTARMPRRGHVVRRLAILKQDLLGDMAGAFELLGPAITSDPSDDELRRRYVELSLALDRASDAARLLGRALQIVKEPLVRSRLGVDLGEVYLRAGDVRRARVTFDDVLKAAVDDESARGAAHALVDIHTSAGDTRALVAALEQVLRFETDEPKRHQAAHRLAMLWEDELSEPTRAVEAWRCLMDSEWADEALERLERHSEQVGDTEGLSQVLACRAARTHDPVERRALDLRATDLAVQGAMTVAEQAAAWESLIARHGPHLELLDRLLSVLSPGEQPALVAERLEQRLSLTEGAERARMLAQLGRHYHRYMGDVPRALGYFREALQLDPAERLTLRELESMLDAAETPEEALRLLEPAARREPPSALLVTVLAKKAAVTKEPKEQSSILAEAAELAETALGKPELAFELALTGTQLALGGAVDEAAVWIERVAHTAQSVEAHHRVARLSPLVQGIALESAPLRRLARLTADALIEAGQEAGAVELLRYALTFEPTSVELLERLDDLLATQASPDERLVLYHNALKREVGAERRRDLWARIATLHQRETGTAEAAVDAWSKVVEIEPTNLAAHQALVSLAVRTGDDAALVKELERGIGWMSGERRIRTIDHLVEVHLRLGDESTALTWALLAGASLDPDEQRLMTVERLARRLGRLDIVETALEGRLGLAWELPVRLTLLEALAEVRALGSAPEKAANTYLEAAPIALDLGEPTRAVGHYFQSLALVPGNLTARGALVDTCLRHRVLGGIAESVLAMLVSGPDARDLVRRVAELDMAEATLSLSEDFDKLVTAMLGAVSERGQRRQLGLARARVLAMHRELWPSARAAYRDLVEEFGTADEEIAQGLDRHLEESEATPEARDLARWFYEKRVGSAADPVEVLALWARVEEERYHDPIAAEELLLRAVDLDRDRVDVWTELVRLRRVSGEAERLEQALAELGTRVEECEGRALQAERAELLVRVMGRADAALSVVEPLLLGQPGDARLLSIVRSTLSDSPSRARGLALLERAAGAVIDPAERATVLEMLLSATEGMAGFDESRARWTLMLLDVRSEDPLGSQTLSLALAEQLPGQFVLWDRAEQLARRLGQPDPVVSSYERVLSSQLPQSVLDEVAHRYVDFHEEWFEDPEQAVGLLQKILEICPGADWAFERLKLAFNSSGRWPELFALYDRALEQKQGTSGYLELLREAAMAAKDFANDPDRAIHYFQQLDELRPGDLRVEAAIERLYERQGLARPLVNLLIRKAASATGEARLELELRATDLWIRLHEALAAFDLLQKMCASHPLSQRMRNLLERLVALDSAFGTAVPTHPMPKGKKAGSVRERTVREESACILRQYYESVESTADVVRMLEIEAEYSVNDRERSVRLERIVQIRLDELGDTRGAFENTVQLVRLDPQRLETRSMLDQLAQRTEQRVRQAELLSQLAELHHDQPWSVELRLQSAQVWQDHVGDAERAMAMYSAVLSGGKNAPVAALTAAQKLEGLLLAARRPAERADVLVTLAELETDPNARRQALGTAARVVLDELCDARRAVGLWQARLAMDPADGTARDGLIASLERADMRSELVAELEERAKRSLDPRAARSDRARIARIYEVEPGAEAEAIDAWKRLRQLHGRDQESFDSLCALLQRTERFRELVSVLGAEAEAEGTSPHGHELRHRLGQIQLDKLGDPVEAVRAFVSALDWTRACEVIRDGRVEREQGRRVCRELFDLSVAAFHADHDDPNSPAAAPARWALEELAVRLRAAAMMSDLVALLLEGSRLMFPANYRRKLLRDAACLCSDQLADATRATAILEALFAEDASDEHAVYCVERFARLLEEANRIEEVIGLWEGQAAVRLASNERMAAAALWVRAAQLAEERLGDVERALRDFAEGAELGLDTALCAQARLYGQRGQHERAAAALARLCSQSTRETLGERSLWLAGEYLKAHRSDLARSCLEDASGRALEVGLVRQRLALLYEELELWRPLAELSALEASEHVDNGKRLELFDRAALIFVSKLGDSAAAIPMLEQALELDQESLNLRIRLAEALMAAGAPERAAMVLREQLERYGTRRPKDRASVHYALARALVELGESGVALDELILASRIDPAHAGILKLTSQLALRQGDLVRAERSLRALLVLSRRDDPESPLRSESLLSLSDIALSNGDAERAKEAIESAFEAAVESEREAVALECALRERGRNDLLARAFTQHLEHAQQPVDAARALSSLVLLLREQGETLGSREPALRRRAEAIESALGSTDADPSAVIEALEQFYSCLSDRGAIRRIQQLQVIGWLDRTRPVPDATLLFELAEQQVIPRESRAQALRLLRRAAEVQPDYPRVLAILSPVLTEEPDWAEGLDLLLDVARRAERKDWLVSILEQRVMGSARTVGEVEEMLTLARELGDKPALMRLLGRAIADPIGAVLSDVARAALTLELAELVERTGDIGSTLELRERAAASLPMSQARPILLEVARSAVDKLGDPVRAASIYHRLHLSAPAERAFWEPLLGLLRQLGDVEGEMLVIERALAASTDPAMGAVLNLEQARILVAAGNDASAAAILGQMLKDDPDCTDAALLLAEVFERGGRDAELILLLSRQLELSCQQGSPASIQAVGLRVAGLHESMRRWDEGLAALERVLAVVPNHRPALEAAARMAEQVGDLRRAASALGRLLPLLSAEELLASLNRLLAIWEQLGDEAALDATLRLGVELLPGHRELVERLVQRLLARGDQTGVVEVLEGAVRLNPRDLELSLQLVRGLRAVGRLNDALGIVESFLRLGEPPAVLHRERGLSLLSLGRFEEALSELEQGDLSTAEGVEALLLGLRARARIDSEETYLALGLREVDVLSGLGRYDEARLVLDELERRFVDELGVLRARARLASTCLDWQGVVDACALVAEVADGPELVGVVLELARASEQLGVPERARSALERALTVEPDNEELRARLGAVYRALGATRELGGLLLDGARRIPEPAARQARLLEIAEMLLGCDGDLPRAQAVLEEARELGPENLDTVVLLARLETQLGRSDEALNLLTESVTAQRGRRSRGLARIYREISQIQLLEGFLSDALESLVKASEMDIRNGSLCMELANLALEIDEKDVALRAFGRAALMKLTEGDSLEGITRTDRAVASYQLALHARFQGDLRKTRVLLQKALGDDPGHTEAAILLAELS